MSDSDFTKQILDHIHTLNNALASAEGFTFILSEEWDENDPNGKCARKAHTAVEQALSVSDALFDLCQKHKTAQD
jgi:hypothetical protein